MITHKQKTRHLKNGATRCPRCRSHKIHQGKPVKSNSYCTRQKVYCFNCRLSWSDLYKLSDIQVHSLGNHQTENPTFKHKDWRQVVANGATTLGYWDWVDKQYSNRED